MLRRSLLVLVGVLSGCASAPATRPSSPEAPAKAAQPQAPAKFDFAAQLARELPALQKRTVQGPGGAFRAELEAAGEVQVQQAEGVTVLSAPLGTGASLNCYVYAEGIDAGATLRNIIENIRGNKELKVQLVRTTHVGALNEVPALYMELGYTVGEWPKRAAGQVKLMVYPSTVAPVLCMHDEPGYAATFRRITEGLVTSLVPAQPAEAPRYVDLQVTRVQGQPVGFSWATGNREKGGKVRTTTVSTMIMPRSATDLIFVDTVQSAQTDAKGQLLGLEYAKVENGEMSLRLSAQRKGKAYTYSGESSGKAVKGSFKARSRAGVVDEPATSNAVREQLLTGKAREVKFEMYIPSADPQAPVDVVYRRTDAGPRTLALKMGPLELSGRADANGLVEQVELPLGGTSLVSERLFSRGTP